MLMGTQKMSVLINYRNTQIFGVDKFYAEERWDRPYTTRINKHWTFFGMFLVEHTVRFYGWTFTWTKNNKIWKVNLDPIIKKHTHKKDITYSLDEEEMRLQVYNLIHKKD